MARFDENEFWKGKKFTRVYDYANMYERNKEYSDGSLINYIFATNNGYRTVPSLSIIDFLKIKKDEAWSEDIARFPGTIDEQQAFANEMGLLSDEDMATFNNVTNNEVPKKFLEMYFNCYMAPQQSDIQWRLGKVTGMYMPKDGSANGLVDPDGTMYTRSNFITSLQVPFWNGEQGKGVCYQGQYFANYGFPPYKIGTENEITDKTRIMEAGDQPIDYTFDQDTFMVNREGYSYREPGFKAINDNINFLQWCLERATGLVSTYLTEWDLSLYMQEHMLAMEQNGGTMKLWLNYRIRQDNPLATEKKGYTGDRALTFGVLNAAVSKIDFDNLKYWRPSDHPYSPYWTPYSFGVDWKIKKAQIHDDDLETHDEIPYMDIYDESPSFSYDRKTLQQITKHDDYMKISISGWKNMDIQYYQTLYTIESDSIGDLDLKLKKYIDKVSGADPGKSGKYDLTHLKSESWADMIAAGGYIGSEGPASMEGVGGQHSFKSKKSQFLKWMVDDGNIPDEDGQDFVQELNQKKANAGQEANDLLGPAPQRENGSGGKMTAKDVQEARRKQASTMGKYVGINRFSPALYGGPHGAGMSPLTIQGFFDVDNKPLRNTPRISPHDAQGFTSEFKYDLYHGNNVFYYNSTQNSCSPTKSLGILKNGRYSYVISYGQFRIPVTRLVRGQMTFQRIGWRNWYECVMPSSVNGQPVRYDGPIVYKNETFFKPDGTWHLDTNDWWNDYYSYFNEFSTRKRQRQNNLWGWLTTTRNPFRMGTYYMIQIRPYKKYLLHDEPRVKWSITTHKCLKYTTEGSWNGPYWKMIRGLVGRVNTRVKYIVYVGQDTLFKLNFESAADEERVRKNMIEVGRGMNPVAPVFFLQGNLEGRFTTGPRSIFQAKCGVEKYATETEVMTTRIVWNLGLDERKDPMTGHSRYGWLFPRLVYEKTKRYDYTPYIRVYLNDIDIPFYSDGLDSTSWTNISRGSSERPLQFESVPKKDEVTQLDDDVLFKFRGGFNYKFYSGKEESLQEFVEREITLLDNWTADYPNPDNMVKKPRNRKGKSLLPIVDADGVRKTLRLWSTPTFNDINNTRVTENENGNLWVKNSTLFEVLKKDEIAGVDPRQGFEDTREYNWNEFVGPAYHQVEKPTLISQEGGEDVEGDYDVIDFYLTWPKDLKLVDSDDIDTARAGQFIMIAGHKIPWYREFVYKRQDDADVAVMDLDYLHTQPEIKTSDKEDHIIKDHKTGLNPGPGTILESEKYYCFKPTRDWFDAMRSQQGTWPQSPEGLENGIDINGTGKFPPGPKYRIEYIPHIKTAQNVSREGDLQKIPGWGYYDLPKDLYDGEEVTRGVYDWRSIGTAGIRGIGLLGKIPGFDPSVESTDFEDYTHLKLRESAFMDVPIKAIPWKTHQISGSHVKTAQTADGLTYTLPGGYYDSKAEDMDNGLKRSLAVLASRAVFFRIDEPKVPIPVDLSVPFRVLYNIMMSQRSFLVLLREVLLESIDFSTLRQILSDCVDKSVMKACGLYEPENVNDEVRPDPNHILYNYWLDQISSFIRDPAKSEERRARLESGFDKKIATFDWAIGVLAPLCSKVAIDWTWRNILDSYKVLNVMEAESKRLDEPTKYIMGYINALYYYRLFFICKRFNKQDGTMWVMRALESILNFVAPYAPDDNPPPSPMKMMKKEPAYKVAFVELQNTMTMKQQAIVTGVPLDEDRVTVCYVKVVWTTKKKYDEYLEYKKEPAKHIEVPEVVRIRRDRRWKYAIKPENGVYSLISKETLDFDKDQKWNNMNMTKEPRYIPDHDVARWMIEWGDRIDLTPIRWGVFVDLDPDRLLTYIDDGISPEELVCLAEVGSDFWTVRVPKNQYPRVKYLKTKVKLKRFDRTRPADTLKGDAYVALLGSQAYGVWPILEVQQAPNPALVPDPRNSGDVAKTVASY